MATKQELLEQFGEHLEAVPDEASNQRHWLLGYAAEWLSARADELFHALGTAADVEAFIREAYKKYAEPIDIPRVPNLVVEPLVDQWLEDALVRIVLAAHARLHPEGA